MTIKKLLLPIMLLSGMFVPQAARAMGHEVTHLEQLVLGPEATKKQLPPEMWKEIFGVDTRNAHRVIGCEEHIQDVDDICFGARGKYVAFKRNGEWEIYDRAENARVLVQHEGIKKITFNSCGRYAALAFADNVWKIWDMKENCEVFSFEGTQNVTFCANSRYVRITSRGAEDRYRVFDLELRRELLIQNQRVRDIQFSPCGRYVAVERNGQDWIVWDILQDKEVCSLDQRVSHVNFSQCGSYVILNLPGWTYKVINLKSSTPVFDSLNPRDWSYPCFSPCGRYALMVNLDDHAVVLFDVSTGEKRMKMNGDLPLWDSSFSPCGKYVVARNASGPGSSDSHPRLWDISRGVEALTFDPEIKEAFFSPCGRYLVLMAESTALGRGLVWDERLQGETYLHAHKVWDIEQGCYVFEQEQEVTSVIFSPCDQYVALRLADSTWKIITLKPSLAGMSGEHLALVNLLAASEDAQPSLLTLARRYKETFAEYYDRFTYEREGEVKNTIDRDLTELTPLVLRDGMPECKSPFGDPTTYSKQEKAERAILHIFFTLPQEVQNYLIKRYKLMIKRGDQLRADKQRKFGLTAEHNVVF